MKLKQKWPKIPNQSLLDKALKSLLSSNRTLLKITNAADINNSHIQIINKKDIIKNYYCFFCSIYIYIIYMNFPIFSGICGSFASYAGILYK